MPSFTCLALMAEAYATLPAPAVAAAPETANIRATTTSPGDEPAGNEAVSIPPGEGWFPVDALYNFGPIRDLFAQRRTF